MANFCTLGVYTNILGLSRKTAVSASSILTAEPVAYEGSYRLKLHLWIDY